jgi:hypothetical protein
MLGQQHHVVGVLDGKFGVLVRGAGLERSVLMRDACYVPPGKMFACAF